MGRLRHRERVDPDVGDPVRSDGAGESPHLPWRHVERNSGGDADAARLPPVAHGEGLTHPKHARLVHADLAAGGLPARGRLEGGPELGGVGDEAEARAVPEQVVKGRGRIGVGCRERQEDHAHHPSAHDAGDVRARGELGVRPDEDAHGQEDVPPVVLPRGAVRPQRRCQPLDGPWGGRRAGAVLLPEPGRVLAVLPLHRRRHWAAEAGAAQPEDHQGLEEEVRKARDAVARQESPAGSVARYPKEAGKHRQQGPSHGNGAQDEAPSQEPQEPHVGEPCDGLQGHWAPKPHWREAHQQQDRQELPGA
mmetsp:Transcript_16387/g.38900  ORF Transcript_16387/g.38900 Transcript_16387/m.38900 type:complete len:307 (+) Transcript_16387:447-1367(+)